MGKEDSGFKVADRRLFTAEGDLRDSVPPGRPSGDDGLPTLEALPESASAGEADPAMTFEALVFSFSTTALLQLGMAVHPETGRPEKDLPGAKQTIDILEILKEKTRGNLTADEGKLLEECLYDLKLAYVRAIESAKS
ncbi:MAG: DUF1844 domain-containing protein [Acidimicrobiia bacterium]|nr:DUF1844 domain-containing protein [Acidimicrobiia bacterium]